MLEPPPGETPVWDSTCVTGLFDAGVDTSALTEALRHGMEGAASRITIEDLPDQSWERAWMEHFRPMRFGRRLWVCPRGQSVPASEQADAVVMKLDPGLAFGTGSHATTALCLEWLDGAGLEHKRVIDYGCGSGILAIAAVLLGAASVVAIDHDSQALLATRDNAAANGVTDAIAITRSGIATSKPADVVLANILAATLVELSTTIVDLVRPGGQLVLSGILAEQADTVVAAYAPFVRFAPPTGRDGWILLAGTRRDAGPERAIHSAVRQ